MTFWHRFTNSKLTFWMTTLLGRVYRCYWNVVLQNLKLNSTLKREVKTFFPQGLNMGSTSRQKKPLETFDLSVVIKITLQCVSMAIWRYYHPNVQKHHKGNCVCSMLCTWCCKVTLLTNNPQRTNSVTSSRWLLINYSNTKFKPQQLLKAFFVFLQIRSKMALQACVTLSVAHQGIFTLWWVFLSD